MYILMIDYTQKAVTTYKNGFHCSQAVLSAFSGKFGMDEQTALKLGGCFGGGMCCGEVCGAVTGALMVLGLQYGHSDAQDVQAKTLTNAKTMEFINAFKTENGSILCRDLLGYDVSVPEDLAVIREKKLFSQFCPKMVESAARILEKMLAEVKPGDLDL